MQHYPKKEWKTKQDDPTTNFLRCVFSFFEIAISIVTLIDQPIGKNNLAMFRLTLKIEEFFLFLIKTGRKIRSLVTWKINLSPWDHTCAKRKNKSADIKLYYHNNPLLTTIPAHSFFFFKVWISFSKLIGKVSHWHEAPSPQFAYVRI